MQSEKSIKKNMIMSVINTSSNFIFPLITYSYVARILHASGTGKVTFVQSILSYFSYIAALGISGYGLRECAKIRQDKVKLSKLVQELLIINACSTIVAYIALVITFLLSSKLQSYKSLFLVMSSSILLQTFGMEWLYGALEEYTYITIRSLFFKSLSVVFIFLFVKDQTDYVAYGFLTIFTTSASNLLNFINARKLISFKKRGKYELKRHLKPIMTFFMSTIIITVYAQFDITMLGFMSGDAEVGIYNTALKIKTILISLSSGLTSVLIPRMSVYYQEGSDKFDNLLLKSFKISLDLMLPLVVFIFINSRDVILFLCGEEYLAAVPTLRVLLICVIALILTNLFGNQILIPKGNEKRYTQSVFIGLWLNIIFNAILIPSIGSLGAAFATLVTECVNAVWMGCGCKNEIRYIKKNVSVVIYFKALACAILLEVCSIFLSKGLNVFWRLSINTVVLFGIFYLFLFLCKEELICSSVTWLKKFCKKYLLKFTK